MSAEELGLEAKVRHFADRVSELVQHNALLRAARTHDLAEIHRLHDIVRERDRQLAEVQRAQQRGATDA